MFGRGGEVLWISAGKLFDLFRVDWYNSFDEIEHLHGADA
jgi:hypothetical protein